MRRRTNRTMPTTLTLGLKNLCFSTVDHRLIAYKRMIELSNRIIRLTEYETRKLFLYSPIWLHLFSLVDGRVGTECSWTKRFRTIEKSGRGKMAGETVSRRPIPKGGHGDNQCSHYRHRDTITGTYWLTTTHTPHIKQRHASQPINITTLIDEIKGCTLNHEAFGLKITRMILSWVKKTRAKTQRLRTELKANREKANRAEISTG